MKYLIHLISLPLNNLNQGFFSPGVIGCLVVLYLLLIFQEAAYLFRDIFVIIFHLKTKVLTLVSFTNQLLGG